MINKFVDDEIVARCANCGTTNSMYIHRPTGKFYCKDCFNKMYTCNRCKKVAIDGMMAEKLWWCLDCYLKDFYSIVRRRPTTEKDFKTIRELSRPIWQKK